MGQTASSVLNLGFPAVVDSATRPTDTALRQLREEYRDRQLLFQSQPPDVQQFVSAQAVQIAEALVQHSPVRFFLPERVAAEALPGNGGETIPVPVEFRRQTVGGLLSRLPARDIRTAVRQRLTQLEWSPYPAVAASAQLVRYATATHLVHVMVPEDAQVNCATVEGAEPPASADPARPPDSPFYNSRWVAFDGEGMAAGSLDEAETCITTLRSYLNTLHLAVSLAPYVFADEDYQRKHYGIMGQLVSQGRALARYETGLVIGKIKRFADQGKLNLGFSLSLPYFDDQALEMRMRDFQVAPSGRILFIPALVRVAARQEQAQVSQDTRLSPTTRKYLLAQLKSLEEAFAS